MQEKQKLPSHIKPSLIFWFVCAYHNYIQNIDDGRHGIDRNANDLRIQNVRHPATELNGSHSIKIKMVMLDNSTVMETQSMKSSTDVRWGSYIIPQRVQYRYYDDVHYVCICRDIAYE